MSGMTTTGAATISDYNSRTVCIEVTGLCQQNVMRYGSYTFKVPYDRMSEMMKKIHRMGGTVVNVQTGLTEASEPTSEPESD